uniref:Uncharacterized protein n=1 Tax=Hyaloperonospora arabidopsidis (strain Emoy2) TaxID=559515 RepID=M4BVS0_HYAAE
MGMIQRRVAQNASVHRDKASYVGSSGTLMIGYVHAIGHKTSETYESELLHQLQNSSWRVSTDK